MGYRTYYELRVYPEADAPVEYARLFSVIEEIRDMDFEVSGGALCGECKWYDHDDDMAAVSAQRASLLYILEGKGEEGDDWWISAWRNGVEVWARTAKLKSPPIRKLLALRD